MRSSKINYLVVGLFVCGMMAALVVTIAALTGRTGAVDNYYAIYRNVTGIKFGTQVIFEGYPIGQVEKVTPRPQEGGMVFRVDVAVVSGWKIPANSDVEIAAPSLLSAKTLSIHAGTSKAALKPGDEIPTVGSADVFGAMGTLADQISGLIDGEVKPLLQNVGIAVKDINKFLVSDGNELVKDAAGLVKDLGDRIPRIAHQIETFSTNMSDASEQVMKLASSKNRESIERLLKDMNATVGQVQGVLRTMKQVMANLDQLVVEPKENVGKILKETRYIVDSVSRHIDAINQNMEGAARNMNEFSRQIRANPGLLLGGSPQEDKTGRR